MDPSHPPTAAVGQRFTRRDLAAGAVATIAASLVRADATRAQTPTTQPSASSESRLAAFERLRGTPLTDAEWTRLSAELRSIDAAGAALRRFPLADGLAEPAFVFSPLPSHAAPRPNASDRPS